MTSLVRRLLGSGEERDGSLSLDEWAHYFDFNNNTYQYGFGGTLGGPVDEISSDFAGFVHAAYRFNGVVFACMLARLRLFSEARFQFRQIRSGRPGTMFGTKDLQILETPWPNGTTGDLLTRMMQDADLAGSAYIARPGRTRDPRTGRILQSGSNTLRRLRPDWVTIVGGSIYDPDADLSLPDADVLGYLYHPGGPRSNHDPIAFGVDEVAHFAPIPDPMAKWIGMSWLTPILREVQADTAAMTHKLKFFEQGATPNMVVAMDPSLNKEKFDNWVKAFKEGHEGVVNAYKTLFLGGGATAMVTGSNMRQIDFAATQGHGETRIASAAGVPPIIVGLSEGLAAATYSNYGQARRAYADGTMRPLWRNCAGSLATLIDVPKASELWYDDRDISFLQEDQKDAAAIQGERATTMHTLVTAGFTPASVVQFIASDDLTVLEHSGMYSVQLQPAGTVTEGKGSLVEGVPSANGTNDVGRVVRALLMKN